MTDIAPPSMSERLIFRPRRHKTPHAGTVGVLGHRRTWLQVAIVTSVFLVSGVFLATGLHTPILYFFFIPVGVASAVFGPIQGSSIAGLAMVLVGSPLAFLGMHKLSDGSIPVETSLAQLVFCAVSLLTMAFAVGLAAERAGNVQLLQRLGARASAALERERRRVSLDIHDGIAQEVAAALMETEILRSLTRESSPEIADQAGHVRDTLAQTLQEIRSMIGQLRPPPLAAPQFSGTMAQMVEDFEARTATSTELTLAGDFTQHTDSMRICVYRVTQEALANIERHANASRVWLEIRATKRGVYLDISDDGEGFEPGAVTDSGSENHVGLRGMRDRVSNLDGHLDVISKPGDGTTIRAFMPGYSG